MLTNAWLRAMWAERDPASNSYASSRKQSRSDNFPVALPPTDYHAFYANSMAVIFQSLALASEIHQNVGCHQNKAPRAGPQVPVCKTYTLHGHTATRPHFPRMPIKTDILLIDVNQRKKDRIESGPVEQNAVCSYETPRERQYLYKHGLLIKKLIYISE